MMSQTKIDNIKTYFVIAYENMPKISTQNTPPTYTSLHIFQDVINENDMAVPALNIDLGHASLTIKKYILLLQIVALTQHP